MTAQDHNTPIGDTHAGHYDQATDDTKVDEERNVGFDDKVNNNDTKSNPTPTPKNSFMTEAFKLVDTKLLENFVPAYFVCVMATGISAAILYRFPFPAHWLKVLGVIMWSVGIFFFITQTVLMVCSVIKYPQNFIKFHADPKVAPFMGCFAMGYNALVNLLYFITGDSWIIGIFVLWWLSVFFCLYTACIVFYFCFLVKSKTSSTIGSDGLHATLLLPIVALTVTSSAGELFVMDLPNVQLQVLTILVSFVLWACAIAMSFIVLTLIFYKYIIHKVPNTTMMFTTFIPIGFLGQGAFSVLLCGDNLHKLITTNVEALKVLPFVSSVTNLVDIENSAVMLANISLISCAFFGLFLMSFGYFNTFVAVATVLSKVFTKNPNPNHCCNYESGWKKFFNGCIKYNQGFWAMTFPLGTMAISNTEFGNIFELETFKVIGAIYGVATVLVTTGCCLGFLYHVYKYFKQCMGAN